MNTLTAVQANAQRQKPRNFEWMKIYVIKDPCGRPYLVRLTLLTLFGFSLKLHTMVRSDTDRELHDHPWAFISLVLAGGYDEEIPAGGYPGRIRFIARNRGHIAYRPALWRHRVILRPDGNGGVFPCCTLVFMFPRSRSWGFWRDGKFIPWREFKSTIEC